MKFPRADNKHTLQWRRLRRINPLNLAKEYNIRSIIAFRIRNRFHRIDHVFTF